ncbi:MAG: hypothetical protein GC161_19105 [Planctomycetaceae bacterium]|nr:hypothetical protein [Planctomycetaceae bacterium]
MSAFLIGLVLTAVQGSGGEVANPGLSFVENRGQWAQHVEFAALWAADGRRGALRAERGRLVLQVDDLERSVREVVAYELDGGADWRPEGRGEVARHHAFLGNDPDKWVKNAVAFERLVYVDEIGHERLEVSWSAGSVELRSPSGAVQLVGGTAGSAFAPSTIAVSGATSLEAEKGVIWATYFGGAMGWLEGFVDGELNPQGDRLIAGGVTNAPDFPTTPGVYSFGPPTEDFRDFVVVVFAADTGRLLWSTTFGGSQEETTLRLAIGQDGRIVFGGRTQSDNFPVTPGALYPTQVGASALGGLSADGTELLFSTYFVGVGPRIALRSDGSIAVGDAALDGAPVTQGAYDGSPNGQMDALVALLAPDGSAVLWATYLGGSGTDELRALTVLPDDAIAVTGRTGSWTFPKTPGAFSTTPPAPGSSGGAASFVTVIEPHGGALRWSAMVGGFGPGSNFNPPESNAIAVGHDGRIAIAGTIRGSYLPPGFASAQPTFGGVPFDGFVLVLAPDGSKVLGTTYAGGGDWDFVQGLAFDESGVVWITGAGTFGTPTTTAVAETDELQIARLTPDLSRYLHSQRLAGLTAGGSAILPMDRGRAAIVGTVFSNALPTTPGAVFPEFQGGQSDGIAMVHSMLPAGVVAVGRSGPPCDADAYLAVVGPSAAGAAGFTFYASQLPGNAAGWLVVGLPAAPTALFRSGPALAVDITGSFALLPWTTDAAGYAHLEIGLPEALGGAQIAAQAVFLDPNSCNPLGLAWTHGLSIHVAP